MESRIVVRPTMEEVQKLASLPDPFDGESFQWGMAAGGAIVAVVGGAVLYFTWPYILATFSAFPVWKEIAAQAKTLIP